MEHRVYPNLQRRLIMVPPIDGKKQMMNAGEMMGPHLLILLDEVNTSEAEFLHR